MRVQTLLLMSVFIFSIQSNAKVTPADKEALERNLEIAFCGGGSCKTAIAEYFGPRRKATHKGQKGKKKKSVKTEASDLVGISPGDLGDTKAGLSAMQKMSDEEIIANVFSEEDQKKLADARAGLTDPGLLYGDLKKAYDMLENNDAAKNWGGGLLGSDDYTGSTFGVRHAGATSIPKRTHGPRMLEAGNGSVEAEFKKRRFFDPNRENN